MRDVGQESQTYMGATGHDLRPAGLPSGRDCDVPDFAFLRSLRSRSLATACYKSSCGGSAKRRPRSVAHPSHRFALLLAAAGVPRATLVTIVRKQGKGCIQHLLGHQLSPVTCPRPRQPASTGTTAHSAHDLRIAADYHRLSQVNNRLRSASSQTTRGRGLPRAAYEEWRHPSNSDVVLESRNAGSAETDRGKSR
jgi:hypothetical protein